MSTARSPARRRGSRDGRDPPALDVPVAVGAAKLLPVCAFVFAFSACSDHGGARSADSSGSSGLRAASSDARAIDAALSTGIPDIAGKGNVLYEVRDASTGAPIPAKLTFVGVGGTPNPSFSRPEIPKEEQRALLSYNRVLTLSGEGRVEVPPGTYDVYVSRGPEWSLDVHRGLAIGAGEAFVDAKLTHEIVAPGWISADFHVHAAPSFDSTVPMRARVYEFACEGVDLISSTDHNVVSDYAPIILELSLADVLTSMHGDEITTKDWGHFGAVPLPLDPKKALGPGVAAKKRTPRQIFADVRALSKDALLTVNHPRFERGLGYFNIASFDRAKATLGREGASLDFDAIEVLNGYQGATAAQVDDVLEDWFALLRHGLLVAATGNSDTHHLSYALAGYPRNYVRVAHDRLADVAPNDVVAAVRAKKSFLTTGPFVELTSGSSTTGDVVPAAHGRVKVHVEVRSASWIPTDTLRIYVGGRVAVTRSLAGKDGVVRFDDDVDLDLPDRADTFVVARVDSASTMPIVVGDGDKIVAYPMAVTNPIFVDADGDGKFTAPR